MDYYNSPNVWSPCSVEDITDYYNSVGPDTYGNACMKALNGVGDTEGNQPELLVQRGCEGSTMSLSCPNKIRIVSANFGRTSKDICSDTVPFWKILRVNCASKQGKTNLIVADACDNKQTCSISVSSGVFGDPCWGTYKYLEVYYLCQ